MKTRIRSYTYHQFPSSSVASRKLNQVLLDVRRELRHLTRGRDRDKIRSQIAGQCRSMRMLIPMPRGHPPVRFRRCQRPLAS
jgi:hypothetical protein